MRSYRLQDLRAMSGLYTPQRHSYDASGSLPFVGGKESPLLSPLNIFPIFVRPRAGETSGGFAIVCGLFPRGYERPARRCQLAGTIKLPTIIIGHYMYVALPCVSHRVICLVRNSFLKRPYHRDVIRNATSRVMQKQTGEVRNFITTVTLSWYDVM